MKDTSWWIFTPRQSNNMIVSVVQYFTAFYPYDPIEVFSLRVLYKNILKKKASVLQTS